MKEVKTNQCDFCSKTSLNKGSLRVHEKKCFYNPLTQSCATCLWFSRTYGFETIECYVGEVKDCNKSLKPKLKTRCNKWINAEVVEEIDLFKNENGILDQLISGDREFLKTLTKLKTNSEIKFC